MKSILGILCALLLFVLLGNTFFLPKYPEEAQTIRIAAVLSLSGPAADFGHHALQGAQLAVSEINATEGVPIVLDVQDDQTDPAAAVAALRFLLDEKKVTGVVGSVWDFTTAPMIPIADEAEVPLLSPTNFLIPEAFEMGTHSFVLFPHFEEVLRSLDSYISSMDYAQLGVLRFQSSFGTEIERVMKDVDSESLAWTYSDISGATEFRSLILELKAAGVDLLFIDAIDIGLKTFLETAAELDYAPRIMTYDGAIDLLAGSAIQEELLEGVVVLNWHTTNTDFAIAYRSAYDEDPKKSAQRSYEAVYALYTALLSGDKPEIYLEEQVVATPYGNIEFNSDHSRKDLNLELFSIEGGELTPLQYSKANQTAF